MLNTNSVPSFTSSDLSFTIKDFPNDDGESWGVIFDWKVKLIICIIILS